MDRKLLFTLVTYTALLLTLYVSTPYSIHF